MRLRLFDIHLDVPFYRAFLAGQERAYGRLGHQAMVRYGTDHPETTRDPIRAVAASDEDGTLLGGIRLHLPTAGLTPSEVHLASPEFSRLVAGERAAGETVAETCGLWAEPIRRDRRAELAWLLTVTASAAAARMGATVLVGSAAEPRLPALERCGYRFHRDHPLPDTPFPGLTSYFAVNRLSELLRRDEKLTAALALLDSALAEGDLLPDPVLRQAAALLGQLAGAR
ncbi:hypothetical protein CFP65_6544 [Kitasatospora sp. MMS16-BH015]|uniref:hypothetical protein n=1 Tax=Kitasatospora sp. MMS16-BH015 TaxID=2018025 RepID=UPI000CA3A0CE|nr:hypothetical protein [Kitasatospora sp. MMS16-BH015]AUG81194.1 hypothetical protein CFP65_6544 [Kitasatospora sp. MMS16-BH015]